MQKFGYFICASAYVLALSAQAIPEQLDIAHYSAPPGVYPPTVGADPVDSSESAVLAWINKLNYNRSWYVIPSAIVPPISGTTSAIKASNNNVDPDGAGSLPGFGLNTFSITLPLSGYNFLALHWGDDLTGNWQAYYVGMEVSASFGSSLPLTEYRFYAPKSTSTPTPDGGATSGLLGLSMAGLMFLRRKA